nr:MAG TPA: Dos2-interacting transcription regulator of RNA-Pol-II [Caudoviricetes sp.]
MAVSRIFFSLCQGKKGERYPRKHLLLLAFRVIYRLPKRKPANKKSSVFLKKISKIRFDILCITFKPPEMPALKVVI